VGRRKILWFAVVGAFAFGTGVGWEKVREYLSDQDLPPGMTVDYSRYEPAAGLTEFGAILFVAATVTGISRWLINGIIGLLHKRRDRPRSVDSE